MTHMETHWAKVARDAKISTCWANWVGVVGGFILSICVGVVAL